MGGVELLQELRREAAWENQSGAEAAARRLVATESDGLPLLVGELLRLEQVDLTDDAGDVADEVARTNAAIRAGLREAGTDAVPLLIPLLDGPPTWQRLSAFEVLVPYGLVEVRVAGERWLASDLDALRAGHIRRLMAT